MKQPRLRKLNMILVTHKWILVVKLRILSLQSMILEKLSIKVNPKKYIDPHGKGKKTRLPVKIWSVVVRE